LLASSDGCDYRKQVGVGEFDAYVQKEIDLNATLVKAAGIKPD
jgi:hypothetical protein